MAKASDAQVMPKKLQQWAPAICERLIAEFPDSTYIAVFGSILTHRFAADSDIDILLLYEGQERHFNHALIQCPACDGHFLEVELQPLHRLLQHFDMAKRISSPILCKQMSVAVVLKDDLEIHEDLRSLSSQILAEGPHPLTELERQRLRRRLHNRLSDYQKSQDPVEQRLLREDLIQILEILVFRLAGHWLNQSSVWTYRELQELHSEYSEELLTLIRDPATSPANAAGRILDAVGGPLTDGFRLQI